jgi:hypothetical protein
MGNLPHMTHKTRYIAPLFLSSVVGLAVGCQVTPDPNQTLAGYLHSPAGFRTWQRSDDELRQRVEGTEKNYQSTQSMDALQEYENAVRAYVDHGFLLYKAYEAAGYRLPSDLIRSLEKRTAALMDVADAYLKQGSTPVAVAIARDVIVEYDHLKMDRAQWRAEGMMLEYSYRTDY